MAVIEARMPRLSGRFFLLFFTAHREFFSACCTPSINDFSPIFCRHPRAKSMCIFSFSLMWLIRSLHCYGLFFLCRFFLDLLRYKNICAQTTNHVKRFCDFYFRLLFYEYIVKIPLACFHHWCYNKVRSLR